MIRLFKHLFTGKWSVSRIFSKKALSSIEESIRSSELQHRAEICFTVEANLPLIRVLQRVTPRARAIEVFSQLRIWDTEENSGVLLYLLLADRKIEIIADRGINKLVRPEEWEKICKKIKLAFQTGNFEQGVKQGLMDITLLLKKHFPTSRKSKKSKNELSDKPVIL